MDTFSQGSVLIEKITAYMKSHPKESQVDSKITFQPPELQIRDWV